jgi:NADH-quinone oxidoreductase subunit H
MKFALFFMAEYIKMIAVSAIAATLFFGGYDGPFVDQVPLLGPLYLFIKVLILLFGMIWVRATLPRIRYDRLMAFGWKIMLPIALANVFLTAVGIQLNAFWLISILTILFMILVVYLARNAIGKAGGRRYAE